MTEPTPTPKSLILDEQAAPKGLEPLRREIIHPDNVALESRMRRAEMLRRADIRGIRRKAKSFDADLRRYQQLQTNEKQLSRQMYNYYEQHQALKTVAATLSHLPEPRRTETKLQLAAAALDLRVKVVQIQTSLFDIRHEMGSLEPQAKEAIRAARICKAYDLVQIRAKEEQAESLKLREEGRIYAHYIRITWQHLPNCHHAFLKGDKTVKETPQFARCDITPTAMYFKIQASHKSMFGWQPGLPFGVYIDDLLSERTLTNIAVTIQRRVRAVRNQNGAWIVVERLNSMDGIRELLHFREVLDYYPDWLRDDMPVCLGVGLNSTLKWLNLADFPHYLVAGETGGGKSNILNTIVCMLIRNHPPQELRLSLIDLKGGLELSHYEGLPHLAGEICESLDDVVPLLAKIESEMHRRFGVMRSRKAKRIETYNLRVTPDQQLPRLVVIFDEFASIRGERAATNRILESVRQISNRGRAVGIHLVICTQHPSVDTVPGGIKTNMTVRIAARMGTSSASITILGSGHAAELPDVPGRMMLKIGANPEPIQTPLITDDDIAESLRLAKEHPAPFNTLDLSQVEAQIDSSWTPEKLIDFSIKHLGGNISGVPLYNALKDDGITRAQVFELAERVWSMETITHEDKSYYVQLRGRNRYLALEEQKENES
jgi:DNA segregation ATPase FtsK/SpoIIIE-like protein